MFSLVKKNKLSSTEAVDRIETMVYEHLKPLGFRKYGRTLHRFVDGDISQVVNFQNGCPSKGVHDILWVNLGIRVPECAERKFIVSQPLKRYYHEYECNIRTRLGFFVDGKDTFYDLGKEPVKIARDVIGRIQKYVLPVFDILNSREAILKHRRDFANFDEMNSGMILLEEAMIYGRKGDMKQATILFNKYYQEAFKEYQHDLEHGTRTYLRKGERIMYRNMRSNQMETITATKSGYVTLYDANRAHLAYLEELAWELNILLNMSSNS